ncbi:hapless 2-like, partial [Teratosphaeria destructans]
MSQYAASRYDDDEPRRYHSTRTRPRERDEPDYVREDVYIERGKGPGPRDLVYRGRDDSVEDIPRNFPPPGRDARSHYADDHGPRRARSARGGRYDDDYDDDR